MPQYHNQSLIKFLKRIKAHTRKKLQKKKKKEYLQDLRAINIHIESVHYIGSPKKEKKPITSQTTPLSFQGIKDKENSLRLLRTERKEAPKSKNMLETRSH